MFLIEKKCNSESGFSLVEVLVGIAIFTLIGMAVYSFEKDVFSLNKVISGDLAAQGEARRAFKIISKEIRSASPSSSGAYALAQSASASLIFYSNIDDDSLKERIRYFLDGATLKKGVIKPSGFPLAYDQNEEIVTEMIHGVANAAIPIFDYYDRNYDGTTPPLDEPADTIAVRLIKITIIIDDDPAELPSPATFTTQVSMRNLKDNL